MFLVSGKRWFAALGFCPDQQSGFTTPPPYPPPQAGEGRWGQVFNSSRERTLRAQLNINGRVHNVQVEPETPLLWVIREQVGLTGTKYGCGVAQCGACSVHINGE